MPTPIGFRHSEETRAIMSKAQRGENNSFYGKHHTEATKAKLRASGGVNHPLYGSHFSEKHKAKLSRASKLLWQDPEYRVRMSLAMRGRVSPLLGKHLSESTKAKISQSKMGQRRGTHHSKETRAKISRVRKLDWQDPEYRDRMVRVMRLALRMHPNKSEMRLFALLDSIYPGEWKYTGDGSLIIAGKNPDFFNINSKKQIIELWGDYWHKGQDPQERIDLFGQYGYKTLIIWASELKDTTKMLQRITHFVRS